MLKKESSDMMFTFDPICHTLVTYFKLAHLYAVCLYKAQISGERLQDHLSSGSHFSREAFEQYISKSA